MSSSSPPRQSFFPSQASSSGMNFTELEQKKYLESMSCLTGRKRSDKMQEKIRRLFWLGSLAHSQVDRLPLDSKFDVFVHDSVT